MDFKQGCTLVAQLMNGLLPHKPPVLALAVSGGSDSLALVHLLRPWARDCGVILRPLIMDHQLRQESTIQAQQVQGWMEDLGLWSHRITWQFDQPPNSGLMEKARNARYQAFAMTCHQWGVLHLCTGHHEGDQLETFLMRRARSSGWRGLAGLSDQTFHWGVEVLRPLLAFDKAQLRGFLRQQGQDWIEDPSNADLTHTRARIRLDLDCCSPQERGTWLSEIKSLRHKRAQEAQQLAQLYPVSAHITHLIVGYPRRDVTQDQGAVLLGSWVGFFHHRPPAAHGGAFWQRLLEGGAKIGVIGTWAGCLFARTSQNALWIFREWGAIDPKPVRHGLWDHRFLTLGTALRRRPESRQGPLMRFGEQSLPQCSDNASDSAYSFHPCAPGHPVFSCLSDLVELR